MKAIRLATVTVVGLVGVGSMVACMAPASPLSAGEASSKPAGSDSASSASNPVSLGGDAGTVSSISGIKAKRPQLMSGAGKVLAAPQIQVIDFQGDALAATAENFVKAIGASAWWAATTKEYGVGPATVLPTVSLDPQGPTAMDDKDFQAFLTDHINAADGVLAAPTDNTLYVFIAPDGSTVTEAGNTGCNAWSGFHSELAIGAQNVAYVVVPRCATFGGQTGAAELTFALGRQLVEAAIDPRPSTAPAFHLGPAGLAWRLANGGGDEAVDLCALPQNAITPPDLGFTVPRSWSNAAVTAGKFPCVPSDGVADVFVEPDEPDTATFEATTFPAVKIAAGQQRTITLHVSAAGSTGAVTIAAEDVSSTLFKQPAELQATFANGQQTTTAHDGDAVQLTITALAASTGTSASTPTMSELTLLAISGDQKVVTFRPLVVGH
jgi:hypothetical protein